LTNINIPSEFKSRVCPPLTLTSVNCRRGACAHHAPSIKERPLQISVTLTVAVRPPSVFSTVCNIAEWPAVIGSIISVEFLTPARTAD
jgi:hypothetical protein